MIDLLRQHHALYEKILDLYHMEQHVMSLSFDAIKADLAALSTAADALIAEVSTAADQATIDELSTEVKALTDKVNAALPTASDAPSA